MTYTTGNVEAFAFLCLAGSHDFCMFCRHDALRCSGMPVTAAAIISPSVQRSWWHFVLSLRALGAGSYTYEGCFQDGMGPYETPPWGSGRTLPAALATDGFTVDQCARTAGARGSDIFALQAGGRCFMGTFADLANMAQRLDDATCSTTPCVGGARCVDMVNKVYSVGLPFVYWTPSVPALNSRDVYLICTALCGVMSKFYVIHPSENRLLDHCSIWHIKP
jgi:hypothetical protein